MHLHKPEPVQLFDVTTYQCSCGMYFTEEQAIKQWDLYYQTPWEERDA